MAIRQIDGPRAGARPGSADALVVFLHGYGADGNDLIGLAGPMGKALGNAAFVSPHAPESCTVNPGGRQWFPIPWLDGSSEFAMGQSFAAAQDCLNGFLDSELERHGLPASHVALAGFSQGTMMALHVGLRRAESFACIVGYSGRLLFPERLATEIRSRPPTLLCHGDADEMVPVDSIHEAAAALGAEDVPVRWRISPGLGHGIDEAGLQSGSRFLAEHIRGPSRA